MVAMCHTPLSSYPAGFVYIYSTLYYITDHGQDIRLAQYIFAGLYLMNLTVVLILYSKLAKVRTKGVSRLGPV